MNGECFSNFRKALPDGEVTELQNMLTSNCGFAMTLWKERCTLYVLGGTGNGSRRLKEVQEYSLTKNIWKAHSQLPEAILAPQL